MTATLPPAVDFYGGTTAADHADHADRITGVIAALAADCTGMNVRAAAMEAHISRDRASASVTVTSEDTAAVDRLADAYGLPPAGLHDDLYDRAGNVAIDGDAVFVRIYCARPQTPAGAIPALGGSGGLPITVASERVDGDK